jgi:hypothetical protein
MSWTQQCDECGNNRSKMHRLGVLSLCTTCYEDYVGEYFVNSDRER